MCLSFLVGGQTSLPVVEPMMIIIRPNEHHPAKSIASRPILFLTSFYYLHKAKKVILGGSISKVKCSITFLFCELSRWKFDSLSIRHFFIQYNILWMAAYLHQFPEGLKKQRNSTWKNCLSVSFIQFLPGHWRLEPNMRLLTMCMKVIIEGAQNSFFTTLPCLNLFPSPKYIAIICSIWTRIP